MSGRLNRFLCILCIFGLMMAPFFSPLWGQEKPKGPPPAKVAVATVESGTVKPQAEFIGTVFYQEVSDVASELSGLVEEVPRDYTAASRLAFILYSQGKYPQAEAQYRAVLQDFPGMWR